MYVREVPKSSKSFIGSFQKTSIPPLRRKFEVNPPASFGCPNTFTIIRDKLLYPPPPDGTNFLRGGSMDLFWNNPFLGMCLTKGSVCPSAASILEWYHAIPRGVHLIEVSHL